MDLPLDRFALLVFMVGTKGCSGGWRAGAGRKPGAKAIKKTGKSKGSKKSSKKDDGQSDTFPTPRSKN